VGHHSQRCDQEGLPATGRATVQQFISLAMDRILLRSLVRL